ncbi:MAG: hypothetical protein L0Y42_06690 [Phycisphaerales bacterium]|nr:hypothetical protein [Phycisphaerales bacterium]
MAVGTGCKSNYVTITEPVAPRVNLGQYSTIGLVTFGSKQADGALRQYCTQEFLRAMQEAQPGTRVIELGTEQEVFASAGSKKWDKATLQSLRDMHGVDVMVVGRFELQTPTSETLSVEQNVDATLNTKLVEMQSGATLWSDSAKTSANVAGATFNHRGKGGFGATDPKAVYGEMVGCLVNEVVDDFRVTYITRRVPKQEVQPEPEVAEVAEVAEASEAAEAPQVEPEVAEVQEDQEPAASAEWTWD